MTQPLTIYYLEMLASEHLNPKLSPSADVQITECLHKQFELNRFFYRYVGDAWQWFDKKEWDEQQWQAYAHRDELRLFMLSWKGTPAGYYELEKHQDGSVEIAYLGVAPAFLDKRLGGYLLTHCIEQAWQWQAKRVWVHTCSLDHPYALANYQARGLQIYQTEED